MMELFVGLPLRLTVTPVPPPLIGSEYQISLLVLELVDFLANAQVVPG